MLDQVVKELVAKERQFLKILTSTVAPIHSSIKEALGHRSFFFDYEPSERTQMKQGDQMNFSYWRAKILSTVVEWAKSFQGTLRSGQLTDCSSPCICQTWKLRVH